jgi:ATP-dependent RNA helicase DDX41
MLAGCWSHQKLVHSWPRQAQGLPVLLSGRDMIGIAFTGSGKTLTFSLPLIMLALDEENKMPLEGGEGPVGIILCPARELAGQTFEVIDEYCKALGEAGYPRIRGTPQETDGGKHMK